MYKALNVNKLEWDETVKLEEKLAKSHERLISMELDVENDVLINENLNREIEEKDAQILKLKTQTEGVSQKLFKAECEFSLRHKRWVECDQSWERTVMNLSKFVVEGKATNSKLMNENIMLSNQTQKRVVNSNININRFKNKLSKIEPLMDTFVVCKNVKFDGKVQTAL